MDFVQNMPMPPMDNKLSIEEQIKMFVEKNSNISLNDLSNEQIFSLAKKIILGNDYHQLYKNTTKIHINLDEITNFLCKDDIEFTRKLFLLITPYVKYDSRDFSWFKNINDDLWIELLKKYSGNYEKMNAIIKNNKYLNDNPINIEKILDIMNLEDRFKFIDENTKNDDFVKFFKKYSNELKNINNLDLYKNIIDKVILYGNDNDKMFLMDLMSIDMIKRYGYEDFEQKLKSYSENELIEKLIDKNDNDLFLKVKKYINQNDFRDALTVYLEIRKKDNFGENLYIYFLQDYLQQDPGAEVFKKFYVKNNDNYLKHLILYASKHNYDNHSFLAQLVSDEKKELTLLLFNSSKSTQNLEDLLMLYNNGIVDDNINKMMENFKKLQEINPGINPENPIMNYNLQFLQSPLFEKIGPQFICDILEYKYYQNDSAVANTLKYSDDPVIGKIISYLKANDLYSTKNVHCIMSFYEQNRSLLINLIEMKYNLSDLEKNNFLMWLNYLEFCALKGIVMYEMKIEVKNIIDLRNFKDKYIEQIYELFDEAKDISKIRDIICYCLFERKTPEFNEIYGNKYLLEQLKKNGNINDFDEAFIEIINDIYNSSDSYIEKKQKYRDIVRKHISIVNRMSKIEKEINGLKEKRVNEILSNKQFEKSKTYIKEYKNEKVKIIDLCGENFNILIHGISKSGGQDKDGVGDVAKFLYEDPSIWNGLDMSSTISCSFISDKYQGRAYESQEAIYYGFSNLPEDEIYMMHHSDNKIYWGTNMYLTQGIKNKNPNRLIKNTFFNEEGYKYNETGIYRKNKNLKEHNKKIQPNYIVSFNVKPTKNELKHAAYFGIPIIHIDEKLYSKINEEKTEKYRSGYLNRFTIRDVREILHLKSFTEIESINLIMHYLDNCNLSEKEYNVLVRQIKDELINYFIDDEKCIDNALDILNQHVNDYNLNHREDVHGYH